MVKKTENNTTKTRIYKSKKLATVVDIDFTPKSVVRALKREYKHIKYDMIACKCCDKVVEHESSLEQLDKLIEKFGPLEIKSGYECNSSNPYVLNGQSFVVRRTGWDIEKFTKAAKDCGFTGFGYNMT